MTVHRSREHRAVDRRHRARLSGAAPRPRWIAGGGLREPGPGATADVESRQAPTRAWIEARISNLRSATDATGRPHHIGDGRIDIRFITRHAPLHPAVRAAASNAHLPDD